MHQLSTCLLHVIFLLELKIDVLHLDAHLKSLLVVYLLFCVSYGEIVISVVVVNAERLVALSSFLAYSLMVPRDAICFFFALLIDMQMFCL